MLVQAMPPAQRMLKPAPVDDLAMQETLKESVPAPLIASQEIKGTVKMIKPHGDVLGIAEDIDPFHPTREHLGGVQAIG